MDIYKILNADASVRGVLNDAKCVFARYAQNDNDGVPMVTNEKEALAYSIARMPATFEAVKFALEKTIEVCDAKFGSCIDVGAGTGSATWAASEVLGISDCICLEREDAMRRLRAKTDDCIIEIG